MDSVFFLDEGDWITLKAKTKHGKDRIAQHGERWLVTDLKDGKAILRSENKTFSVRTRDAAKTEEWTTHKIHDGRWIDLHNDDNFTWRKA